MSLKKDYLAKPFENFWLLNTDSSSLIKKYSPTLPGRSHVYKPNNKVKGNKPVDIGYEFSTIGLSARQPLYGISTSPWNLPLSMRLIPFEENKNSFTARQVNELLDNKTLPFHEALTVNALDSNYSSPEYIAQTHGQENLINIIRLASNRNVWEQLTPQQQQQRKQNNTDNRGTYAVYGTQYKLNEVEQWDRSPERKVRFGVLLANGKQCIVQIDMWENMLLRTKRGKNMKDKAFDLVSIQLLDAEDNTPIFERRIWLGVWGQRRKEIKLEEIYWAYRNRYDVEHFFRFGKQRLLLDKFQSPDDEHLQNWFEVVSLAYWLLWVAKDETRPEVCKWQQYDPNYKKRADFGLAASPSQVQQQAEAIILSFEQKPFFPKVQKKGKGRQTGETQPKRKRYKVLYKKKKVKNKK